MPDDDDKLIKLLKNFIDNKAQLIDILKQKNKNIKLNKNSTYKDIIAVVGKRRILNLLELQSIDEGFRKINVQGLLSNLNRNQVRVLAKELNFSGKTKTECLNAIWKIKETEISDAIKNLYNGNKISGVFQYNNIVLGPLGILDSHYEREYEYGDVINILNNFGQTDLGKIAESLKIGNGDDTKDHVIQKILTDFDNEKVILAIQQIISKKQIQMPEISKWSKLVITPCGIFERKNIYVHHSKELYYNKYVFCHLNDSISRMF
ncbi:MAG: hypothetical protein Q8P40_07550 [Nitrospirota bacterium]|nr:hypothetical protein [Nitrospirota bacterium]